MIEEISNFLNSIELKEETNHRNLTVFALCSGQGLSLEYLVLDEALERELVIITEITEAGSVPELKFINKSSHKILILDGEELTGARQNRIVNATILVGEKKEITLPVSCVEAHRWAYTSDRFGSEMRAMPSSMRRSVSEDLKGSFEGLGAYRSNQSRVWRSIYQMMTGMGVHSKTGAMSAIYEGSSVQLDDYVRAFGVQEGQVGILCAISGSIIGCDIFGMHDTLKKLFPKLVQSYALDALRIDRRYPQKSFDSGNALRFLEAAKDLHCTVHDSVDLGQDARLEADNMIGSALVFNGQILHLTLFQKEMVAERKRRSFMRSLSQRRRTMI